MAGLWLWALSQAAPGCSLVVVEARDGEGRPLAAAALEAAGKQGRDTWMSPADGVLRLCLAPGGYELKLSKPGYLALSRRIEVGAGEASRVEFQLEPARAPGESVTVRAPAGEAASSSPVALEPSQIKPLPGDPATVRDALPLVPGVVRGPEGKLRISDMPEHRSALQVNSLDVTDPATGKFGATAPIDAVASLNVYKSPFLAEYGRFSAGVVAVDTRRGGEKWHYELNDPTPELRFRSRRIRGVRGFTPRLSWNGPLVPGRLYLSQAIEYALKKTPVKPLPFPRNEEKRESWNGFTQLDYAASAKHLITVTLHGAPQRANFSGLGLYQPQPAAPGFRGHEYTASFTDRAAVGGRMLESAVSVGQTAAKTGPQGDAEYEMTPTGNLGNYFHRQRRQAGRVQWLETLTLAPAAGHQIKLGGSLARTGAAGEFHSRPFSILGMEGERIRRTEFSNRGPFRVQEWEAGGYGHDHWLVRPGLSLDAGLRSDTQTASGQTRLAPRAGAAWSPLSDSATTLRAGLGWFFDRVPLNVAAFDRYPEPRPLRNVLGTVAGSRAPLVFGPRRPGNFAPASRNWRLQGDHRFPRLAQLRATYLETRSSGLVVLRPGPGVLRLEGEGRAWSRSVEVVSRLSWRKDQQLVFSYAHTRSRAHQNDFNEFLGDFPSPLVRPDALAVPGGNLPHRFLAWGVVPLSKSVRAAPVFEYRSGFPYTVVDAAQNYVGAPNSRRFPRFLSLDLRISKDIRVRNHAVQLSVSGFNLTNHFNPESVRWNTADPLFGEFLGQRKRRYWLDLDILF